MVTTHRDNGPKAGPDDIAFVTYREDEEPSRPKPEGGRIELFRRSYGPDAAVRPPEREKRIKFEVVDDSVEGLKKRSGFNPYESSTTPKKPGPRR